MSDIPTLDAWFQRVHDHLGVVLTAPAPTYPRGLVTPEPDESPMVERVQDGSYTYQAKVAAKAGSPLRMPLKPPPCFPGRQREWDQYRLNSNYVSGKGFTYCTDCTPERKAEMVKQGRCQYPKTVFVISHGVQVGRRKK